MHKNISENVIKLEYEVKRWIYDLVDIKVKEYSWKSCFIAPFFVCPTNAPSLNDLELQKFIKTVYKWKPLFTNQTGTEFILILETDLGLSEIKSFFKTKIILT